MAFLVKTLSCFFFLVLISSPQIQARNSKFFDKFIHISAKNKVIPESQISQAPTSAPALAPETVPTIAAEPAASPVEAPEAVPTIAAGPVAAPAEAPASFYAESGNGYGLYGHGSGQFPPTKETFPSTANENDLFNEELSAENHETGYRNGNYKQNVYASNSNYNNNGYNSNYNNNGFNSNYNNNGYNSNYNYNGHSSSYNTNGYVTEKQGMSDTRFMQNYQNNYKYTKGSNYNNYEYTNGNYDNNVYARNYNNNGYTANNNNNGYSSSYNTESYETEKKGMSDTRFLENGKYYHDVKNEKNYFPTGFQSERGANINEGYYGNTQNANELDAIEEFENEQEYQQSPEKYVP